MLEQKSILHQDLAYILVQYAQDALQICLRLKHMEVEPISWEDSNMLLQLKLKDIVFQD